MPESRRTILYTILGPVGCAALQLRFLSATCTRLQLCYFTQATLPVNTNMHMCTCIESSLMWCSWITLLNLNPHSNASTLCRPAFYELSYKKITTMMPSKWRWTQRNRQVDNRLRDQQHWEPATSSSNWATLILRYEFSNMDKGRLWLINQTLNGHAITDNWEAELLTWRVFHMERKDLGLSFFSLSLRHKDLRWPVFSCRMQNAECRTAQ